MEASCAWLHASCGEVEEMLGNCGVLKGVAMIDNCEEEVEMTMLDSWEDEVETHWVEMAMLGEVVEMAMLGEVVAGGGTIVVESGQGGEDKISRSTLSLSSIMST